MNILILDDDILLLKTLETVLGDHQHTVQCANNAEDAIECVKSNEYDCILVDYKLPGKDGIWFMENADIPSGTKVLLITAYINRTVINRMFELGAAGYLIKPFDDEELMSQLEFHSSSQVS
jgi:two-component system response regulator AtoC